MSQPSLRELLNRYNQIYKETNEFYHHLARRFGLPDCAFWILYTVRESASPCTQAELCAILHLSRQTVNSAIQQLRREGYLDLLPAAGRAGKPLALTAAGEELARGTVDRVFTVEEDALGHFSPEELEQFLALNRRFVLHLRRSADALLEDLPL